MNGMDDYYAYYETIVAQRNNHSNEELIKEIRDAGSALALIMKEIFS